LELVLAQGLLAYTRGDLARAAERMGRALVSARRQHAYWDECECLLELAWVDLDRGHDERVLGHAEELAAVAAKLGESAYAPAAESLRALARLPQEAEPVFSSFEASLTALQGVGANRVLSIVLNRAAWLALSLGADARARSYAEQALAAAQRVERANEVAAARVTLAELALRARDTEHARRHLEELSAYAISPDLFARTAGDIARVRELARTQAGAVAAGTSSRTAGGRWTVPPDGNTSGPAARNG
jgi:tetratricopeptide (TPR) repeat protein